MRIIDLRSDTVTQPTANMRQAMYEAEVGDDVFGEDPTVNRLQLAAAQRIGKEAGLFVVSGQMANLVSVLTHCGRGEQVVIGSQSHICQLEQGGVAVLGGIYPWAVENLPDGRLHPVALEKAIDSDSAHAVRTSLICLENTWRGFPLSGEYCRQVGSVARKRGVKLHLDGARLFNAAVALQCDAKELAEPFDSVCFCFSKGLCAPVGSIICGSSEFIARARRNRKLVGGGMRQAGVLAAAALVALQEMVDRLHDDHDNAKVLAGGLARIDAIEIDPQLVCTNILMFSLKDKSLNLNDLISQLAGHDVLVRAARGQIRAVTHAGISKEDVEIAVGAFEKATSKLAMLRH